MKILFINPPTNVSMVKEGRCMQRKGAWTAVWAPITLAISAAMLRDSGFDVRIIDCSVEILTLKEVCDICKQYKPDLVIINTATPSIESDLNFAAVVKDLNLGEIKVAVIGIHVSVLAEECLKMQSKLDFVVRGEVEFTLKELAEALRSKREISKVKGISYHYGDKIMHNPDADFPDDLDSLPFPAWDLIDINKYRLPFKDKPFLLVSTGKGCPYNCIFCCTKPYYGSKLRLRSPARVVNEIEWVENKFNVKDFLFWTESFTLNKEYATAICNEIILRGLSVDWVCNSRVDAVSPELLKTLKKAGCWMIGYGIESGDQAILDMAKKNTTLKQIEQAIKWTKDAGIEVTAHTIFGLPGETKLSIDKTMKFLKKMDVDFAQIYCAVPFPGSALFDLAKRNNWILNKDWMFFEQNFSVLNIGSIDADAVMSLRKKALVGFYFRPRAIFQTIRRIKSFKDFKVFLNMLKEFISWI